ncbi:hypothetical protein V8E54_010367 [Elaphomyces granulatus]
MPPRFICPYATHNPSKYNAANRYKACMDPGFPTVARLKAHIKKRHYDEEHIPTDVRYQFEQQRRKQRDEEKWESLYNILFPGEIPPSPCMHMIFIQAFNTIFHMCFFSDDIGTIIVVTDSSLTSQGDLNDASQLSSTRLPVALEDSMPTERDGQPGNIATGAIVQGQETSSMSRVPLIVTNGFSINNPEFLGNGISPYTNEPGLDQQPINVHGYVGHFIWRDD